MSDTRTPSREGLLLPILIPVATLAIIGLALFGFSRVLLSVSKHAATGLALIVAASIMVTAGFVSSRKRLTNASLFSTAGTVAGVAMLAGGIAIIAFAKTELPPPVKAVTVTLAAPAGAAVNGYAEKSLSFPAGKPVDLVFENQDPGVQHNVVVFGEDPATNASAQPLYTGDLITGPAKTTLRIAPLKAATYYFHCEVHPSTMTGKISVSAGGGGGGGGGGVTVVAEGLQFQTKTIDLLANQATTITFDNKDVGQTHNIAIATDQGFTNKVFTGDLVVGPSTATYDVPALDPGTYYFHCDVHPDMSGTVIVK